MVNILFALEKYLDFYSARHKILSKNIENVNTPNFKALDISPDKFLNHITPLTLLSTHSSHFQGKKPVSYKLRRQKDVFETKPNGNNINVEQQLLKVSRNSTDYNTALQAYSNVSNLISLALGKGGG